MGNKGADEEHNHAKEQLGVEETPRDHVKVEKGMTSKYDNDQEVNNIKKSLENATQALKIKDKTIQTLKCEVEKLKDVKSTLSEKDTMLHSIKKELDVVQAAMARTKRALSDNKKKVEELHAEVEKRKESESKLLESLIAKSNQLQEMNEMVEKYNIEGAKMPSKQEDTGRATRVEDSDEDSDEIRALKKELMRAIEAEENSNRAIDDLALALKEVVSDAQMARDELQSTEEQLKAVKEEVQHMKRIVKEAEQNNEAMLKDLKRENDQLKNTVKRLKKEAEESQLSWNGKEIEFVDCIRTAEAEKDSAKEEHKRVAELLRETEEKSANAKEENKRLRDIIEEISANSKEENKKLRDILGQALNEASMAKEAANIAKEENSFLKDSLAEKDKALASLAQETECLRINEAEASESIKELKRIIVSGSKKEAAKIEKENKDLKKLGKKDSISENNEEKPNIKERRASGSFSFDLHLHQLWPVITTTKSSKESDHDHHEKDDALSGSIFDLVESPAASKESPEHGQHRRSSSACSDDMEHFEEGEHFDDMEMDRHSHGKRKALLKRFGDLIKRKNNHPSHHQKDSPKDNGQQQPPPPKEVPTT